MPACVIFKKPFASVIDDSLSVNYLKSLPSTFFSCDSVNFYDCNHSINPESKLYTKFNASLFTAILFRQDEL